jgi:hypothetical protein
MYGKSTSTENSIKFVVSNDLLAKSFAFLGLALFKDQKFFVQNMGFIGIKGCRIFNVTFKNINLP